MLYIDGNYHEAYDANPKPDFVNKEENDKDHKERCQEHNYSAGDYQEEFDENFQMRDDGLAPELGIFETNTYFEKLYPALKIQKPGYDLYASTNIFLFLLLVYTFFFNGQMTVDQANYLKNSANNAEIFKGNMIITMFAIIILIIFERILNRTDTKEVQSKGSLDDENKSFFAKEELFKKSSTERSMTVKIKTMKTSDLEIGDNSAQSFLNEMYGEDAGGGSGMDDSRTKITT